MQNPFVRYTRCVKAAAFTFENGFAIPAYYIKHIIWCFFIYIHFEGLKNTTSFDEHNKMCKVWLLATLYFRAFEDCITNFVQHAHISKTLPKPRYDILFPNQILVFKSQAFIRVIKHLRIAVSSRRKFLKSYQIIMNYWKLLIGYPCSISTACYEEFR